MNPEYFPDTAAALLAHLIARPAAPKYYRLLHDHYRAAGDDEAAAALAHLIEVKFSNSEAPRDANSGGP